jgi:hypothetical protein
MHQSASTKGSCTAACRSCATRASLACIKGKPIESWASPSPSHSRCAHAPQDRAGCAS